ncbi:MAG: O-antigen ligase family protein [Rhizobiales bacterium]|nr:O-antigen ligase family protein [Hyphomicrobiales bacterium]NRB13160.1 O-antigen ligase family protein [Hyphomicrobiales bacterium]
MQALKTGSDIGYSHKRFELPNILLFLISLWVLDVFLMDFSVHTRVDNADDAAAFYASGGIGNQVFWLVSFLVSVWLTVSYKVITTAAILHNWALILLIGIGVASCVWSASPWDSFRRIILQIFVAYSLFAVIFLMPSPRAIFNTIYLAFWLVLSLDLIFLWLNGPQLDIGFPGIHGNKNTLGFVAASAVFLGIGLIEKQQTNFLKYIFIVFWLILLFISQSKTSIALCFVAILAYGLMLNINKLLPAKLTATLLVGMFFIIIGWLLYAIGLDDLNLNSLLDALDDGTLTGRAKLWKFAIDFQFENGVLGYGYGAFWGTGNSPNVIYGDDFIQYIIQGHNGYLDIILQFGYLGYVILAGILCFSGVVLIRSGNWGDCNFILFCFCLLFILHNLTETSMFRSTHFLWLIMLIVYFIYTRDRMWKKI